MVSRLCRTCAAGCDCVHYHVWSWNTGFVDKETCFDCIHIDFDINTFDIIRYSSFLRTTFRVKIRRKVTIWVYLIIFLCWLNTFENFYVWHINGHLQGGYWTLKKNLHLAYIKKGYYMLCNFL
jgi:hypothetical protein